MEPAMFIYFGKRFRSEHVGERVIGVACAKCGNEYFYELSRMGIGIGSAPYGLGVGAAARAAQEQSQHDLGQRLRLEAELVPCPKCYWINEDLVQGYRRGRYQRLASFAIGVGFFGTVISLIAAWFISIGPPADRGALRYCLYYGPALFVSFAVGMFLLQYWLRSRIRPNRYFPLAPKVPPGSPPALVRDESSGELIPARVHNPENTARNDWHYFRIGQQHLPRLCCECLGVIPEDQARKSPAAETNQLDIPHCKDCAREAEKAYQRILLVVFLGSALIGSGIALFVDATPYWFWVITVSFSFLSVCLGMYVASVITAPAKVAIVDRNRCLVKVRFRNAEYGRVVAEHSSRWGKAI
jgi:hypothetical protein